MSESPNEGVYSVAYLEVRRDDPEHGVVHGWAWAAWWIMPPTGKPWRTPDAFGIVEQLWGTAGWSRRAGQAEIEADEAIRAAIGSGVATKRIDDSFARAAFREHRGKPARYQAPRPTKYHYAKPEGHDRAPTQPARRFFEAHWRDIEERVRANERAHAPWRFAHAPPTAPRALTELGLDAKATADDVRRAFRGRALVDHPDRGGTSERFRLLVKLRDQALGEIDPTGP